LEKKVWFAFCERILLMRELDRGKRSIEEYDDVSLSENAKRQRGDNSASTGFASGPAGRRHFLFTGTATIHLNIDIESLSKEIEQRQGIATQWHKAHDQAGPSQQGREVRLFGVNIADSLGRQQQEASSSRQQFGWQGQEAFHLAQPHQETRSSSQQEVIDDQMPLEISSDSDNEPSHERIHYQVSSSHLMARGSIISFDQIPWYQITQRQRNAQLERTGDEASHRQMQGDSASLASRPDRSLNELLIFAEAVKNRGHRERLPKDLLQSIRLMPFNNSEYRTIQEIYKAQGFKDHQLGNLRRRIYNMTEMGKAAIKKYQESPKDQAKKKEIDVKGSLAQKTVKQQ
jgi:hypothetical protein